ncbi:unnamed protein product [Sympodiomycopsis kandeliae]
MEVTSASQWDPRGDALSTQYRNQDVPPDSYIDHGYQNDAIQQQQQQPQYASDAHSSSLGNGVMNYGQSNGVGVSSYRQHSPGQFSASPGYRVSNPGYPSHGSVDGGGMPHPRQASISSVSSNTDYGTSPTISHAGSRNNSIYSLDGQMGSLGMSNASVDPSTGQPLYGSTLGGRYAGALSTGYVDRRFSLDERSRPPSGNPAAKPSSHAASSGRSWPWGPSSQNTSVHPRASYDYTASSARVPPNGSYPTYDPFQHGGGLADGPSRLRSMSSSAIGGRTHPYGYQGAGSAASAAAAMGLVPHGEMLQMDAHGHPIQGVGLVGPQIGPGGGATRRAKFKRSRTGCLVCRKRKVKCSQDGTPCKQCRIGKRDCYYDDNPPKRKRKGKNSGGGDGSASNSDSAKPGTTNGGYSKPHLGQGSGAYDSYPQLPPPPGVAFSMPFGQSNSHQHSHGSHSAEDPHTFGSAGWPAPSGEAHNRASFDAGGLAPESHDSHRSGSFASSYDHRVGGLSQSAHSHTSSSNGGWYDPVTEQHSRPIYGSDSTTAHS